MFKKVQKMPTYGEISRLYPIKSEIKQEHERQICDILNWRDKRKLLVIGPCSLDEKTAAITYLQKLKSLSERVGDRFLIVPRLYTAKPRSRGGFKGLIHTENGIKNCRQIHAEAVNNFGFSAADELLYPSTYNYFCDTVGYYAIGTRSSLNQEHRFFASGIEGAVGFKNPPNGDLGMLADSILVARSKNTFFKDGDLVETDSNPNAHGILRGFSDNLGEKKSNFDIESVRRFDLECKKRDLGDVPLIIDFSHDNSGKNYLQQIEVANAVIKNFADENYSRIVRGFMIESYIFEGAGDGFGRSRTDGCLSFDQTESLILHLYNSIL